MHPWSVLFNLGGMLRALVVPVAFLLFATFFRGGDSGRSWVGASLASVGLVVAGLIQVFVFFTTKYRFEGNDLVVKRGLLFRNERRIPMAKVQNIDLVQNLLHRVAKVATVKLETASGAGADATFSVLSQQAIDELRQRVFAHRTRAADASDSATPTGEISSATLESPGVPVLRLSLLEVVKLGLMTFRGIVLVAVALALAAELGLLDWVESKIDARTIVADLSGVAAGSKALLSVFWIAGIVLGIVALLAALSIVWSILRFYGFNLTRFDDDLRVECGLLTKVSATVPRGRIQFISVRQTPIHRFLDRATIRIETAGGKKSEGSEQPIGEKWIAPLVPSGDVQRVLRELRPGLGFDAVPWEPVGGGAKKRMVRKAVIIAALVGAPLMLLSWKIGLLVLISLLGIGIWAAIREAKYMACGTAYGYLYFRSGAFTRQWSAVPLAKLQTMSWTQSPFDIRHEHATLRADTAGAGPAGHAIAMRYFPKTKAEAICHELYRHAGRTGFSWT